MDDGDAARLLDQRSPSLGGVLQQAALTVNSSLHVNEVLERLAGLVLEAVPADRCAIFLLDEQQSSLVPTYAVGRTPNEAMWQRFLHLRPIELKERADRWQAYSSGRAVYIPDLRESPLVPTELAEEFDAGSALLMPLIATGQSLGLLSVDWPDPGRPCSDAEIDLVETIGAYAALAIRNARLYEGTTSKARALERLVEVAGALSSTASLRSVLEMICASYEELLATSHCSVNLLDDEAPGGARTMAQLGQPWGIGDEGEVPAGFVAEIEHTDAGDPPEPIVYRRPEEMHALDPSAPPSVGSAVLFPLVRSGAALGFVLAGFGAPGGPSPATLEAGRALADLAATAMSRARLHRDLEARLQRVEILHRLSDVVSGTTHLSRALRKLDQLLPAGLGVSLESVCVVNPQLREVVGAQAPDDEDLEAVRSWRTLLARGKRPLRPRSSSGGFLVPMAHRRRVLGVLRVAVTRRGRGTPDDDLLLALASGCAEVIYKAGLHRELAESERRLAIVAERERIARDLHDSAGQLVIGLGMMLDEYAEEAPDPLWRGRFEELRDLAARGSREIRGAIYSLLFLQVQRRGLTRSLRELASKFRAATGIDVDFSVRGDPVSLPTPAEDALFRVAHEALMNVERHSEAGSASVELSYASDVTTLSVTDDGVGLGDRDPFEKTSGRFGLLGLRRLMEESRGGLEVFSPVPRGLRVEGWVPIRVTAGGRH